MNSNVHPAVAVLVLLAAALAIGLWAWANGEAAAVGGPSRLVVAPNGHLFIQVGNRLLEHATDGTAVATHDLSEFGVDVSIGDIAFFPDGDLLLRAGGDPRGLIDRLRAFRRLENPASLAPARPGEGLVRCEFASRNCEPFGMPLIDPKATFGLEIDATTGEVYLSDTSRHRLRRFAESGRPLGEAIAGFRFPNELLLHGGRLYIADTNHHEVAVIALDDWRDGAIVDRIDVVPPAARDAGLLWPTRLARVGDEWWIILADSSLADGRLYRFDADWQVIGSIALPGDPDPLVVRPFGDDILVSDWRAGIVHRIAATGEVVGKFESPALSAALAAQQDRKTYYRLLSWTGVGLVGVIVLGLLLRSLTVSSVATLSAGRHRNRKENAKREPVWLEPDPVHAAKLRRQVRLIAILIAPAGAVLAIACAVGICSPALLGEAAALFLAMIALIAVMRHVVSMLLGTAVGIDDDRITLRDWKGRTASAPASDVRFDGATLRLDNILVFLGRGRMPIYDRDAIAEHLLPRLEPVGTVPAADAFRRLVGPGGHERVLTALLVLGVVVVAGLLFLR